MRLWMQRAVFKDAMRKRFNGITYACGSGFPADYRRSHTLTHWMCAGCKCFCHYKDGKDR